MRKIVDEGGKYMHEVLGPFPGVVKEVLVPARDGHHIRCIVYKSGTTTGSEPIVVWCHGGGFCLGNPDEDEPLFRHLCFDLGCVVVSIDYRRAPEFPFPVPINDCWDALEWVCHSHPLRLYQTRSNEEEIVISERR